MKKWVILVFVLLLIDARALSLCDGCEYEGRCYKTGTQWQLVQGGEPIYCSMEGAMRNAKEEGENCLHNYECKSFYCAGTCKKIIVKEESSALALVLAAFALMILSAGVYLFAKYKLKKKVIKKETKKKTYGYVAIKGSYKRKHEELEKKLRKIMKKI